MVQHSWQRRNICEKCGLMRSRIRGRFWSWTVYKGSGPEPWSRIRPECAEIFAAVDPRISAYIRRELNG